MPTEPRVIVVDDEPEVRAMVADYLARHGFRVAAAENGAAMRAALAAGPAAVVLLDVTMPGEDGFTLARELRARGGTGIIMLTANGALADRVSGLEAGADDYIVKPFAPRELLARVRSLMRRMASRAVPAAGPAAAPQRPAAVWRFGRFTLDRDARVLIDEAGRRVALTVMEYDLLRIFAESPNAVLSREALLARAHNKEMGLFDRSLDMRITRLRRKIEANPEMPQLIRTVRGEGYIFTPDGG
jgi:two-component system phosphate regulon response regulator OmpR